MEETEIPLTAMSGVSSDGNRAIIIIVFRSYRCQRKATLVLLCRRRNQGIGKLEEQTDDWKRAKVSTHGTLQLCYFGYAEQHSQEA